MEKYQKKKRYTGEESLSERAETGGTFPGKGRGAPGNFHTDAAKEEGGKGRPKVGLGGRQAEVYRW